jgi:hypothetical protein
MQVDETVIEGRQARRLIAVRRGSGTQPTLTFDRDDHPPPTGFIRDDARHHARLR